MSLLAIVAFSAPVLSSASPVKLECHYRDGWYIKMHLDIVCSGADCSFQLSSHGNRLDAGKALPSREGGQKSDLGSYTFSLENGGVLRVVRTLGRNYRGILDYGSLDSYNLTIQCRDKSER
jgi:hypothetical protein